MADYRGSTTAPEHRDYTMTPRAMVNNEVDYAPCLQCRD